MKRKNLSNLELSQFCEEYAMILRSGISGEEGLSILLEDNKSAHQEQYQKLLQDLQDSSSLSIAMEESNLFPKEVISYTKVGEETGSLDEIMESLSDYYERQDQITHYIRSAISYPLFMLGIMIVIVGILLAKVLPSFSKVFSQIGLQLNQVSRTFLSIGTTLSHYAILFSAIILGIILFILWAVFTESGRKFHSRFIDRIPFLRDITRDLAFSRLAFGIYMGIRCGLGADGGIALAMTLNQREDLKLILEETQSLLEEGYSFDEAIAETKLFSGVFSHLVSIGIRTGSEERAFKKLSRQYEESSVNRIYRIVSAIEPTMVILLSTIVGIVLISVMLPLLGILSEMMV